MEYHYKKKFFQRQTYSGRYTVTAAAPHYTGGFPGGYKPPPHAQCILFRFREAKFHSLTYLSYLQSN
jgi:hypothetical protein